MTQRIATPRAALFVPATATDRHSKAFAAGADAVIIDLEDAVAAGEKDAARLLLPAALSNRVDGVAAYVRINDPTTAVGAADLRALEGLAPAAIVAPKACVRGLASAAELGIPLVALIETAVALTELGPIAASPGVQLLMLGPVDLRAELGARETPGGEELLVARSQLVIASAVAALPPPLDGPFLATTDRPGLERELERARDLGFGGKACIHPNQVEPAVRAFTPGEGEYEWAGRVVAAYEEALARGEGVCVVDGEMVDLPVVTRARRTLERGSAG